MLLSPISVTPKRKRVNQNPLKMLAINDVAYPMHVWRNFMDVFESSASENTIQGGDVEQNTISDTTTLREASEQLPLHAGVQVGRPDGSLALHIDGPTMGTRVSGPAAKRQRI